MERIEERYSDTDLYTALREIISGTPQFPMLVTSRRRWSENIDDVFYSRSFRSLYLAPFGETERAIFIQNAGQDPQTVERYISANGLDELCNRPFFLEQVLLLGRGGVLGTGAILKSRSDIMRSTLSVRYNEIKKLVLHGRYQSQWPDERHLAAAAAFASLEDDRDRITDAPCKS